MAERSLERRPREPRSADLIAVRDLSVEFDNRGIVVPALSRISFRIRAGSTVALVGESGSGKSVTAQAIMGILPATARITGGEILFATPGVPRRRPTSRSSPATAGRCAGSAAAASR